MDTETTELTIEDQLEAIRGQTDQIMTGIVIPTISEELIKKAWKWLDETLRIEPKLSAGTFVLIEIMQKARAFTSHSKIELISYRPHSIL